MSGLEIPERALDLAYQVDAVDDGIRIAAPIIVAAELRRLAAPEAKIEKMVLRAYGECEGICAGDRDRLLARADELDPPAVAP